MSESGSEKSTDTETSAETEASTDVGTPAETETSTEVGTPAETETPAATETAAARETAAATETAADEDSLGTTSEIEVLGPCKRRIKATVPVEKVREHLDRNYRELIETVQLPGFRRGRVPRRLLERRYGEEVEGDVKETLLSQSLAEVLENQDFRAFGSPRFDNIVFKGDDNFRYEVEIEVYPEFELPRYKGMEVEIEPIAVDDEEVEKEMEALRRESADLSPAEIDEAGAEDFFFGHYHLYRADVEVKVQEGVSLCPRGKIVGEFMVDDLEEHFSRWNEARRAAAEDEFPPLSVAVKVPDSYPDELLRGEELRLEFFVEEAKKIVLPELDDEFAAVCGEENLEALKANVRTSLEARRERETRKKTERDLLDRLLAETDLEVPQDLVQSYRERMGKDGGEKPAAEAEAAGDAAADREASEGEASGAEEDSAESPDTEELRRELKEFFILDRIGEKEKIFVTEDEVKNHVNMLGAVHGVPGTALLEQLKESGKLAEVRITLRNEKVKAFLRKRARAKGAGETTTPAAVEGAGSTQEQSEETTSPAGADRPAVTEPVESQDTNAKEEG